jgi:hypothetical protein
MNATILFSYSSNIQLSKLLLTRYLCNNKLIMRKSILFCLITGLIIFTQSEIKAQEYKNAIGGRFGVSNGVTFKTFLDGNHALDLILNFRSNSNFSSFRFIGLYEVHAPLSDVAGLNWFYGGGGSIGSLKNKTTDKDNFAVSLDGVLGLDYKFTGAPINISLDWKPAINISPETEFDGEGLGLSLRFTF